MYWSTRIYHCDSYFANFSGNFDISIIFYLYHLDDGSVVGSNKKTSPGAEPRKRITIGTNIVMTKGKSVELICPTRGGKRPQLSWMKDNAPIVPSNYIVPRGEVLLLQYVQPNMNGYYSCTLTTEFGSSVATSHVKINGRLWVLLVLEHNLKIHSYVFKDEGKNLFIWIL